MKTSLGFQHASFTFRKVTSNINIHDWSANPEEEIAGTSFNASWFSALRLTGKMIHLICLHVLSVDVHDILYWWRNKDSFTLHPEDEIC